MNKQILKLFGIVFFSIMTLSISSCGEDPVEDMEEGQEQVDEEKEEETNPIVGAWKNASGYTVKFNVDGTGYIEHNGDFEWFAYTFNSKTYVVTITDGMAFEDDIDKFKIRFIEENIIQLGWWDPYDEEWYFESDEIYYRQSSSDDEDDDEDDDEISISKIIGTWKYSWGDGYALIQIQKNGTALYSEWDNGGWDAKDEMYYYEYDASNSTIYYYDNSYDLWERCKIVSITSKEMKTKDFLDGGIVIWKRQ